MISTLPQRLWYPDFLESLRDPEYSSIYVQSVIEEDDTAFFLTTLRDLVEAHGGMTAVAKKAGISRTHLYKMLSKGGNPTIQNIDAVLRAVGLRLTVTAAK